MTTPEGTLIQRFLGRLRFPQLFMAAAVLFLVDMVIPDFIPFIDEALLAIGTMILGSLEKKSAAKKEGKPPIKDVTPDEASPGDGSPGDGPSREGPAN